MSLRCLAVVLALVACAHAAPPQPSDPRPISDDERRLLARASNAFGLDLYARLRARGGNLALSPASVSAALALVWAGARGATAAEMQKVLHLDGPPARTLAVAGAVLGGFGGGRITLQVANRLFGAKSFTPDPGYVELARAAFGAPLEALDFKGAADEARRHINAWVAEQTRGRIPDLLPPGSVRASTRLVVANAIYFLADWQRPFRKDATQPAAFHAASGSHDVPTMHQTGPFRFAALPGVKVLEMPYVDPAMAMVLVLPDAQNGLGAIEDGLDAARFERWIAALADERVRVALPKLTLSAHEPLALASVLVALGMPLAFDAARADLGGIATPASPADRLAISEVFHKAFVKVDEKGTEAAAATGAVMVGMGAPVRPPAEFIADHPFLFFVRDTRSGLILFMGRASDPTSSP